MNHPNIIVDIFHKGELVSSQPWMWDDEVLDYFSSDDLYFFHEGFNDEIVDKNTAEIWGELEAAVIMEVQNCIHCKKPGTTVSVASDSYEAVVSFEFR